MPLESIRFSNGTCTLEVSQTSIQGKYGLLRFSRNKPYWDPVSLYIHPPNTFFMSEINCSTWNVPALFRIILNWYWVSVSTRPPPVCCDSVSLRLQGGRGADFLRRHFPIYINIAIKKYVTHRTLDLTTLINQVIHKEFSWSSFPPAWGRGYLMYHRCIVSHNILDT